ncbi:hypothetical protein HPB51_023666 [Rhipicephalus microplus]|uniref:Uncharacterized protein n=1 Tax=Rhipicephalus microplus TaxID=6941 RepID=A0A9J6DK49_RHIMP|nr:hypothetical protein HPB51_023666 [Rhipicephalus microplus]
MYRNNLRIILGPSSSFNYWRDYSLLAERTTEFLWRQVLPGLRTQVQKKPSATSNPLPVIGDVNLPDKVRQVLKCGPKFTVEPRKSSPELLGMVRNVSKQVPEVSSVRDREMLKIELDATWARDLAYHWLFALFVVFGLSLAVPWTWWLQTTFHYYCDEPYCTHIAEELRRSLDLHTDPCENFYSGFASRVSPISTTERSSSYLYSDNTLALKRASLDLRDLAS